MFCIPIPTSASTPFILDKSRMRKRARTDLCGGRPAMVVPTATVVAHSRLSELLPNCCQPTTIRYVDTEYNYELLTSRSKYRFEMWDQALTDARFGPSVVLRIRDQGSACQVP